MTIVKWKRPLTDGTSSVLYNSPITGLFENFLGDSLFTKDYASFVPAVNVAEEEGQYTLEFSAPGFEKSDFKVELEKGILFVSAEHKSEEEKKEKKFTRKEFNYGSFQRSFTLPEGIKEEAIDAKYENGILKISLLKKEEVGKQSREIKIS